MGQEISHQSKSNIVKRHKSHQQIPQSNPQPHPQREVKKNQKSASSFTPCKGKYNEHSENFSSIYAPSSTISTTSASSTDDEHYRLRQKYNLNKQTYEKSRIAKKLSLISNKTDHSTSTCNTSTTTSSSTYKNSQSDEPTYTNIDRQSSYQQKRKSSSSTDSGIYYASCNCPSSSANSTSSSLYSTGACGCAKSVSASTNRSRSSLDHTKNYLCRHLYIKSYLDILEEDEKARAQFKSAKPGGIRNYKPKILSETALAASAPLSTGFSISASNIKLREKCKEDPWI